VPISRASGPFDLPDPGSAPSSPPAGVRIYALSGKFQAKNASGTTFTIPMADVPNPASFSSPSSQSGDFASASAYTQLRADCARLHDTVRDLQNAMRAAGWMG
jgi:hypothetical protein